MTSEVVAWVLISDFQPGLGVCLPGVPPNRPNLPRDEIRNHSSVWLQQ